MIFFIVTVNRNLVGFEVSHIFPRNLRSKFSKSTKKKEEGYEASDLQKSFEYIKICSKILNSNLFL